MIIESKQCNIGVGVKYTSEMKGNWKEINWVLRVTWIKKSRITYKIWDYQPMGTAKAFTTDCREVAFPFQDKYNELMGIKYNES